MLFPTTDFAIFFIIVFVLNWLLAPFPARWKLFMIVASYVFYAWCDSRFVILLAVSTLTTIAGGILVYRATSLRRRRAWLAATVVAELGLLGWFKYYGFLALNVDNALHRLGVHVSAPLLSVTLPVGISFFTFMGLSYVIDIFRGKLTPYSPIDVAVFVCFFPHLVAGPIVRGSELLPQIRRSQKRNPRHIDFPRAAYLIFAGLFKKVVVSSYVSAAIVDPVFGNPGLHSGPEALVATWAYAVQIYCDFSGYTDIAIGCALLLGFRFPENFNAPYTARSLQDFWRRWHMTLSFWLRDYVYIPLGGSQGLGPGDVPQHHDHDAARRPVARRRLDVHRLGRLARDRPVHGPLAAQTPRGQGPPGAEGGTLGHRLAAVRHISVRLPRLGVLSRHFVPERLRDARPHGEGLVTALAPHHLPRRAGDRVRHRHPVRAAGPVPPCAGPLRPTRPDPARDHARRRTSGHHDDGPAGRGSVHLLSFLIR